MPEGCRTCSHVEKTSHAQMFKWWEMKLWIIVIAAAPTGHYFTLVTGVMVLWLRSWRFHHHSCRDQGGDWPPGKLWLWKYNRWRRNLAKSCFSLSTSNIFIMGLIMSVRFKLVVVTDVLHKGNALWEGSGEHPVKSAHGDFCFTNKHLYADMAGSSTTVHTLQQFMWSELSWLPCDSDGWNITLAKSSCDIKGAFSTDTFGHTLAALICFSIIGYTMASWAESAWDWPSQASKQAELTSCDCGQPLSGPSPSNKRVLLLWDKRHWQRQRSLCVQL